MHSVLSTVAGLAAVAGSVSAQYSTTWNVNNLPKISEQGQSGTNQCSNTNSQSSDCQNVYVNSIDDFCLWAPPEPNSAVGSTEEIEVAWCTKDGHGTRTIPEGALTGVHFVQTPDYVQITGVGNLAKMNINAVGGGGELDPYGATGLGNPIGGLVFSSAFGGGMQQIHEWTNFMSEDEFCIRVCKPGPNAWLYCNHVYDVMGCAWNMPGNYNDGVFETCQGDSDTPMGIYSSGGNAWGSTFHQGDARTPDALPAAPSSQCQTRANLGLGAVAPSANAGATTTSISSSSSSSSKVSTSTVTSTVTSSTPTSSSTSTSSVSTSTTTPTTLSRATTVRTPLTTASSTASNGIAGAANANASSSSASKPSGAASASFKASSMTAAAVGLGAVAVMLMA